MVNTREAIASLTLFIVISISVSSACAMDSELKNSLWKLQYHSFNQVDCFSANDLKNSITGGDDIPKYAIPIKLAVLYWGGFLDEVDSAKTIIGIAKELGQENGQLCDLDPETSPRVFAFDETMKNLNAIVEESDEVVACENRINRLTNAWENVKKQALKNCEN